MTFKYSIQEVDLYIRFQVMICIFIVPFNCSSRPFVYRVYDHLFITYIPKFIFRVRHTSLTSDPLLLCKISIIS